MSSPFARAVVQLLALAGGWVPRTRIEHELRRFPGQLDDELVLLVSAGSVRLNPRGELYCLAGSPLARRALQRLAQRGPEHHRELLMAPSDDGEHMRVALAVRLPAPAAGQGAQAEAPELVMAEFEIPHHKGCPDKAQDIATFAAKLLPVLGAPVVVPADEVVA